MPPQYYRGGGIKREINFMVICRIFPYQTLFVLLDYLFRRILFTDVTLYTDCHSSIISTQKKINFSIVITENVLNTVSVEILSKDCHSCHIQHKSPENASNH